MTIVTFFLRLAESYLVVVITALVVGLLFSDRLLVLTQFTTILLQVIFFLSSLKLQTREVIKQAKDLRLIIGANVFMLIIVPGAAYVLAKAFIPELAIPLLLIAAMPSGMTTPLLVEVVGGRQGLALVLTITSSLLAPFTIPAVIGVFAGAEVAVNVVDMFVKLLLVIVVPFVLAQIVRSVVGKRLKATYHVLKPISILLLGLLIAGAVAKQASVIFDSLGREILLLLVVLFLFVGVMLAAGYFVASWRHSSDRLTVAVSVTFMNFTLAIYLADAFFPDPRVLLASVLVIIPWCLMLVPFKYVVRTLVHQR